MNLNPFISALGCGKPLHNSTSACGDGTYLCLKCSETIQEETKYGQCIIREADILRFSGSLFIESVQDHVLAIASKKGCPTDPKSLLTQKFHPDYTYSKTTFPTDNTIRIEWRLTEAM